MKRSARIVRYVILAANLAGQGTALASFNSLGQVALSASATVGEGAPPIIIVAAPLPPQAFFGKNVVIPVIVTSDPAPLNSKNLQVAIFYQLMDSQSTPQPIGALSNAPVQLQPDPLKPNTTLGGVAVIPRDQLLNIQHGGQLLYFFQARQAGTDTVLGKGGVQRVPAGTGTAVGAAQAFQVAIIDNLCLPVSPAGARVSIPDLFARDGTTSANFAGGALSAPGTLCIRQLDPQTLPTGPGGQPPLVAYAFDLQGASLVQSAQIVLSYPADIDGKVTGTNFTGTDLSVQTLDAFQWRLLGRPSIDTTVHTVAATTTHFSDFALFATGVISSADLRPTQRIITPNGDGINDTAVFATGIDEVHLFDIRGRRVRTIPGPSPVWDGKDDNGKIVESGVYMYQYTSQGDRISGVIMVAK